jgi:hypothetical protein
MLSEYYSATSTRGLVVSSLYESACGSNSYIQWSIGIRMLMSLNIQCNHNICGKHECRHTDGKIVCRMKLRLISSHFPMLALMFICAMVGHLSIQNQIQNIGI